MSIIKKFRCEIILILMVISAHVLHVTGDYMVFKPMTLTVMEKYPPPVRYKGSSNPIMVFKTEDGRLFDQEVSYTTSYRFNVNDRLILELREFDIKQTVGKNVLYFFLPLIFTVVGVIGLIMSVLLYIFFSKRPSKVNV